MGSQITKGDIKTIERIERSTVDSPRQVSNDADLESETIMKTEELSGKRKRAPTKAFVPAESQKKMRVSKREKGKVRYSKEDDSGSEEEDYEVKFIVDDRYIKGKRQFKVRWVNYGPKDDTWVSEADMSCPRLVEEFEEKKKDKEEEDEDDDDDDAADYEVEECIDVREVRGKKEFLIKWKNFTPRHNTWEPESNLDCPQLMKKCLEKKSGKATASSSKKSPKKAAAKTKKASPKKGAKKGRKSAKNGKKPDDEADEEHEEEGAEDEVEEKEAEAGNDDEETKEDETEEATKEEGEDEEESKNDADDEDDDKVEDKRRSKPGPKSKKKK